MYLKQGAGAAGIAVGSIIGALVFLALVAGIAWLLMQHGEAKADLATCGAQNEYMREELIAQAEAHRDVLQELGIAEADSKDITNTMLDLSEANTERRVQRNLLRLQNPIPEPDPIPAEEMAEIDEQTGQDPEPGFWQRWWNKWFPESE